MVPSGYLVVLLTLLTLPEHNGAFFGWFSRKTSGQSGTQKEPAPDPQSLPNAPFEMITTDDKFLAEAKQLEMSPLDSCHYKVVSELRASCTEMSEEEIAKLGVVLFNCQAEVEGRQTYPCTEDMDGQEQLKELTSESLQKVLSSQDDILSQQEQLQTNQEKMETSIHGNLELLTDEKALIASGHHLVAEMIEGITKKMENVSSHLIDQDAELHEGHKAILADLSEVRLRSQEVYHKIESNLALFLSYQNKSAAYYDVLMEKLHRMNQSLSTVLYVMDHMHRNVELRLTYIQGFIGWAGGNLNAIYTCVLHAAYFLLLAFLMTFLQTPGFSRAVLLVLIVINALSELNQQMSLDFRSLTVLLVCTMTGHWMLLNFICCLVRMKNRKSWPALPPASPPPVCGASKEKERAFLSSTPERTCEETLLKVELKKIASDSFLDDSVLCGESLVKDVSIIASPIHADWKMQHGLRTPSQSSPAIKLRRFSVTKSIRAYDSPSKLVAQERIPQRHLSAAFDALSDSRNYSPNSSMASNLSVSSMSPRQFCQAVTRAGQPCRNKASSGQEFCRVHSSGQTSYTAH